MVFLDIWLADRDGLETLQALREADPTAAVVMMSGHGTTSTAVKAIKMGAFDYLEKPLSYKRAVDAAAGALAYKRTLQEGGRRRPRARAVAPRPRARPSAGSPPLPPAAARRDRPPAADHPPLDRGLRPRASTRASAPAWCSSRCRENSGIHFVTLPTGRRDPGPRPRRGGDRLRHHALRRGGEHPHRRAPALGAPRLRAWATC